MSRLQLRKDRTDVDLDRLAQAFSISRIELEGCLGLGIISYWYELGASDYGTPQMAVRSTETEGRIALTAWVTSSPVRTRARSERRGDREAT